METYQLSSAKANTNFETQYTERAKLKRQKADQQISQKRQREEADPIRLGLSRRPEYKIVKSKIKFAI